MKQVVVTGGAGYVGAVLVPKLLEKGYEVCIYDTLHFGLSPLLESIPGNLHVVQGDIRDKERMKKTVMKGADAVIHLAAISNDPCSELDHELTRQVNFDGALNVARAAQECRVERFINVSTSSVYGIKQETNVTEDLPLEPLTIYSTTKAWAERAILNMNDDHFTTTSIRSATACGYSPRMRLDLVVNILTAHAIMNNKIRVFGGEQKRPNIHVSDIADLYVHMLEYDKERIGGEAFNVGFENHTVMEIAHIVQEIIGNNVEIEVEPTDDKRSYHISSEKLIKTTGFKPQKNIKEAIIDIKEAFKQGKIPEWKSSQYYNVKKMKELNLK